MLPVLNVGPLALPTPELIMILGFWLGLELTEKQAFRYRVDATLLYNLILIATLAGLIGARLVYAAMSPAAFLSSPLNLLALTPQMMDATGGLVVAVMVAFVYGKVKGLQLWPALDALTTLFSVLAVVIGLANFASGNAFGIPSNVPWAIDLWGEMRHPTQVYQTLAALVIAAAVWPPARLAQNPKGVPASNGMRFWVFVALTAVVAIIIETFRGDSMLLLNSFRQVQVIGWLLLAVSLWQIGLRLKKPQDTVSPVEAAQEGPAAS